MNHCAKHLHNISHFKLTSSAVVYVLGISTEGVVTMKYEQLFCWQTGGTVTSAAAVHDPLAVAGRARQLAAGLADARAGRFRRGYSPCHYPLHSSSHSGTLHYNL